MSCNILACSRSFCTSNNQKNEAPKPVRRFNFGVSVIPHIEKRHKGGEDANYSTHNLLAVADGVGGWAESGVDPAKYPKELCTNIQRIYEKPTRQRMKYNPKEILIEAATDTRSVGSSTCCIAILDPKTDTVHTANLGDSGYVLIRKEGTDLKVVYKSTEQTHQFNFPFQIGTGGDNPATCITQSHEVKNYDVIILATDGLWDNMYVPQLVEIVRPFLAHQDDMADPELVAEMIAQAAEKLSNEKTSLSPFGKRARDYYYEWRGGKQDDITVLVAQILLGEVSAPIQLGSPDTAN